MEPEPDRIDLSVLDPHRDRARWEDAVSRVAARALELRQLRRVVVRRGATALVLAAAAALALWFTAPKQHSMPRRSSDLLEWATRDVEPGELLNLGGGHAP